MTANTIPSHWSSSSLFKLIKSGDKINYGVVQPGQHFDTGVPLVRVGDLLNQGISVENLKRIAPEINKKYEKSTLVGDEILLACVGSIGTIGLVKDSLAGANIARAIARIRCNENLERKFLYWYLKSPQPQQYFRRETRTVAQPTLNIREIKNLEVPLPPIAEQRRIAAILDKADGIRRDRKQAIQYTEDLLRSAFLDMFGDPVTNPKGWEKTEVSNFGEVLTGNTPPRSEIENYGNDIEWIKSDNITTPEHFLTEAEERLSKEGKEKARTVPSGSTLVTCIAGSKSSIGRAAITDREVTFNQQINAVVPNSDVNPYFLYSHFFIAQHLVQAKSTNSMKGMVNKSKFSTIEFVKPPKREQDKFGDWFLSFYEYYKRLLIGEEYSNCFFNSLLQRAFKGDL